MKGPLFPRGSKSDCLSRRVCKFSQLRDFVEVALVAVTHACAGYHSWHPLHAITFSIILAQPLGQSRARVYAQRLS